MSENMNQHGQTQNPTEKDPNYWRTLEQWGNDPEFQKLATTEFTSSPLRDADLQEGDQDADTNGEAGFARREFLKLMGASMAMATTACIRRPVQKVIPYNKAVEEVTFGIPNYYTSSYSDGSEVLGLLVKTREGRPIKIEGNPNHPLNLGATSARAQASILSLYDPERLQGPKKNLQNKEKTNHDTIDIQWQDADTEIVKQLGKGGVVVMTGAVSSPSMNSLINEFAQGFKAKHVVWEPLAFEEIREGQKASYGDDVVPFYRFDKAKMIVSIDADFLGTWVAPTTFTRQFSAARKDPSTMNKLVAFNSNYSLTGANADIRIKIKPSQQVVVAMGLAYQMIKKGNTRYAGNGVVKSALEPFANAHKDLGISEELFAKIAEDLWANKGKSLVVAGGLATQTAAAHELQVAVNFLNSALENDGATIDAHAGFNGLKGSYKALSDLVNEMQKGGVKTLIIHGVNPMYVLGNAAGFHEALKKVETVIYTGDRIDETGFIANYVLPDNHAMENWGDLEAAEGIYSIQQPTIRPMYNTRSFALSMMTWAKAAKVAGKRITASEGYYEYVRAVWKDEVLPKVGKGGNFENAWDETLQKGVVDMGKTARGGSARAFKAEAVSSIKPLSKDQSGKGMELVLYPTTAMGDGRYANISWLQELPDPVTKICWDNYAGISIATAEKLKIKEAEYVEVTVKLGSGETTLRLPAHIQPGLHDDVVAIAIGYGRTKAGKVGNGVGSNAYTLMQHQDGKVIASGSTVEIRATGISGELACVAGNNTMEGRKIVAEATLTEYLKDKASNNHRHHAFSIWSGHAYNGHKWAMAVDLNTCTGCSACMVACQAENNIPVVGKKYVLKGREMHWMRIDRYYVGDPKNAEVVFQPVMCQQCDNAPCETVCPVLATAHSDEGLNDMAYNRCVGTRYCSNNCPYKVRRFNWFNFTGGVEKPLNMQYNPDVTVRVRGVMEKCTFCVHRIKFERNQARLQSREIKDGDIKTACEQVCPSSAITFGDVNDPTSRVAKIFKDEPRSYGLIEEFNAAPSVRYMTKIRNNDQQVRMPGAQKPAHESASATPENKETANKGILV